VKRCSLTRKTPLRKTRSPRVNPKGQPVVDPKKKKRKRNDPKKTIRNACDRLWAMLVKKRWGHHCAICGKSETLNAHHLIGKTNYACRYEVMNGIVLCVWHHVFGGTPSAHQQPANFLEWVRENRPEQWDWIEAHRRESSKATMDYFRQHKTRLTALLDNAD
jgi:hypothetical protein